MVAQNFHLVPTVRAAAEPGLSGRGPRPDLVGHLLDSGAVSASDMMRALAATPRRNAQLSDTLLINGMVEEGPLLAAQARQWETEVVDPTAPLPDVRLVDAFGAARCLAEGLVPWRRAGGPTLVACARPELFERHRPELELLFGPVVMAIAAEGQVVRAVMTLRGAALAWRAEHQVPPNESCRKWPTTRLRRALIVTMVGGATLALSSPRVLAWGLALWAAFTLVMTIALKGAAAAVTMCSRLRPQPIGPASSPAIARLPVVSLMVPLYRETDIAASLLHRLGRLNYPRELLDILLIVEAEDSTTRAALAQTALPRWMRIIRVPPGTLKTKPRALNFALDFCRGSIIGIYDAEDAPDPDQIRKVVDRFHARGPEVACLQGVLDYYNPRSNWMARCFTIEYAAWFRVVLPGLERMGLPVPLGGTTVFLRRAALEALGRWDSHNVTEDADLGLRLARHGLRTEILDTVTAEEANCRPLPWVRQRSRWLKGYMITWAVHMRDPVLLWRQLGGWGFAGVQVLFLGTLSQFLLAPVLWSFWLLFLGAWHPLAGMPPAMRTTIVALFLVTEAVNAGAALLAVSGPRHRFLVPWVVTLGPYFALGALAAYKATWELITRPFFWDKTSHGHFDTTRPARGPGLGRKGEPSPSADPTIRPII